MIKMRKFSAMVNYETLSFNLFIISNGLR
jgi:hypothetical protein